MGLDPVRLILAIEDEFGTRIPDEDYEALKTVGLLRDYILRRCSRSDSEAVFKTIQRLVNEELLIPIDEIKPESRWIEDLKLD